MLNLLKTIFRTPQPDEAMQKALAQGAVIIDVRTPGEFSGGHAPGAVNIPLNELPHKLADVRAYKKPVVVCCASGMRSANARVLLTQNGISEVYDAGNWRSLQ